MQGVLQALRGDVLDERADLAREGEGPAVYDLLGLVAQDRLLLRRVQRRVLVADRADFHAIHEGAGELQEELGVLVCRIADVTHPEVIGPAEAVMQV